MRKLIALFALVMVGSFYTPVRAPQQGYSSTCYDVWDKDHTHILYITCPTNNDDVD